MIYEIDIAHAHLLGGVLPSMHQLRHRLYVEGLHWDVPTHEGMEFDQFDTLPARYLIGIEPDGTVRAVQRNLFCDRPYMLQQLWPELVADPDALPTDASWAEGTRSGVDQELPPAAVQRWSNELLLANFEWAFHHGCKNYTFVTYEIMVERVMRPNGLPVELWGTPVTIEGATYVAGHFPINEEIHAAAKQRTGISEPVLVTLAELVSRHEIGEGAGNVA